jgi:hypothetical protein
MRPETITRPGFAPSLPSYFCRRLPRVSKISCAYNDPFSTLGVPKNATDAEIKAAHRKRVKEFHPDIAASKIGVTAEAAHARFISIQQAYELLTGKARGKEVDFDSRSSVWSFHDFYWSFKLRNRRKAAAAAAAGQPSAASPRSPPPPPSSETLRYQWKSQLQGLKQKAAARKYCHQASPDNEQQSTSAVVVVGASRTREEEEEEPIRPLEVVVEEEQVPRLHDEQNDSLSPQKHHVSAINRHQETEDNWSHIVSFFSEGEPGDVTHSDGVLNETGAAADVHGDDHPTYVDRHARKFADSGVLKERVMHQFVGLRRRAAMMKEVARSVED